MIMLRVRNLRITEEDIMIFLPRGGADKEEKGKDDKVCS